MRILETTGVAVVPYQATEVWREAFSQPPYSEQYTPAESQANLLALAGEGGDLLLGQLDGEIVAIAGGQIDDSSTYWLEELAVKPELQGRGLGRKIFKSLIDRALAKEPNQFALRTSTENSKALKLYVSEGFTPNGESIVVPSRRTDGRIRLDERVYLTRLAKETEMKEEIRLNRIAIVYPSGNTTAVVFDQLLDSDRQTLNDQIMSTWSSENPGESQIEQCCFVTMPTSSLAIARVEMFGGEFCGNATRSVIALLTKGENYRGFIEVSGVDRVLQFKVKDGEVEVEMPLPTDTDISRETEDGLLVELDGISQLVVTDSAKRDVQAPRELLIGLLESNQYGLADLPAVGVSYYDETSGKASFCVWVKEVNTIFDETACGSGTCAIGVALARKAEKDTTLDVIQPSGETIKTKAFLSSGKVTKSTISGGVSVIYDDRMQLQ